MNTQQNVAGSDDLNAAAQKAERDREWNEALKQRAAQESPAKVPSHGSNSYAQHRVREANDTPGYGAQAGDSRPRGNGGNYQGKPKPQYKDAHFALDEKTGLCVKVAMTVEEGGRSPAFSFQTGVLTRGGQDGNERFVPHVRAKYWVDPDNQDAGDPKAVTLYRQSAQIEFDLKNAAYDWMENYLRTVVHPAMVANKAKFAESRIERELEQAKLDGKKPPPGVVISKGPKRNKHPVLGGAAQMDQE